MIGLREGKPFYRSMVLSYQDFTLLAPNFIIRAFQNHVLKIPFYNAVFLVQFAQPAYNLLNYNPPDDYELFILIINYSMTLALVSK